jgi:prepilin-type N-terminal cleavage/methylation domain-containing protein
MVAALNAPPVGTAYTVSCRRVGLKPDLQVGTSNMGGICRSGFSPTSKTGARPQRGFTLMELVISILVLGILGATAAYGIQNGVLAFQATEDALDSLGKLRYATERLARELREVRRDPLDSSRHDITTPLAANGIAFVKQDGTAVSVAVSGTTLTLEYDNPAGAQVLTDRLGGFSLGYFDADGNATASDTELAFIELEIVLSDSSGSLPQRTHVALRSRP